MSWYSPKAYFQRATMAQPDRDMKFGESQHASMKLSSDGTKLYSLELQGQFKIWDTKTYELLSNINHKYLFLDEKHLSIDSIRGIRETEVYELETNKFIGSLPYDESGKNKIIGFSSNANQVWVFINDHLELYDVVTKQVVGSLPIPKPNDDTRWNRDFSPRRTYFPMIDVEQNLHIVDLTNLTVTLVQGEKVDVRTSVILFSDDEQSFAIGHDSIGHQAQGIRVYHAPHWTKSFVADADNEQAKLGKPIFFSHKANLLLVEHWSSAFRAYDTKTGKLKYPEFKFKTLYPSKVSPSGKWLVGYPEGDYNVVLYDLSSGKKKTELCPKWCYARADSGPEHLQYEFNAQEDALFVMGFDTIAAWSISQPGSLTMLADPSLKTK